MDLGSTPKKIEEEFGVDYLALIQGKPVEQPIKVIKRIHILRDEQGEILSTLAEEYIQKRDDTLVLSRLLA